MISESRTASTTLSGKWSREFLPGLSSAAHAGFVLMAPQKAAVSSSDNGNILDKCEIFGSVWRLCLCGQWHTSRKPTRVQQCNLNAASALSFLTTLRLACSRLICKTSRLSLDLLRFEFHTPVAPSSCMRRSLKWPRIESIVGIASKKRPKTIRRTERLREATSHNQPTIQHRTADPHKEDKPLEDLEIRPTI